MMWSGIAALRKIVFILCIVFQSRHTTRQLGFLFAAFALSLLVTIAARPYRDSMHHHIDCVRHLCAVVLIVAAIGLNNVGRRRGSGGHQTCSDVSCDRWGSVAAAAMIGAIVATGVAIALAIAEAVWRDNRSTRLKQSTNSDSTNSTSSTASPPSTTELQ
eukprot:c3532_g1_i1.p1 GENE.c3532_g1_i1~~c3532_g1_i1.p1  ORF type:complete len:160 (-),score=18.04 c3532_g1_i1:318-797(-)